jgi:hypothetical protein
MAKPEESLREILTKADLLAHSGGTLEEMQQLARPALRVYRWALKTVSPWPTKTSVSFTLPVGFGSA